MTARLPITAPGVASWQRAVSFGAAYFACAEAGRFLSVPESTYVSFWLPAGLYVAVLLLNERRNWPGLVAAALAANAAFDITHGTPVAVALLFSLANTVQSLASAWLVTRFVSAQPALSTLKELATFLGYSAVLGSAVGTTLGTITLGVLVSAILRRNRGKCGGAATRWRSSCCLRSS